MSGAGRRSASVVFAIAFAATALLAPLAALRSPALAQAGEYRLETTAVYRLDPEAGRIDVSVDVTFTNTSPDPPGAYTIFERALLAVQDGASDLRAADAGGPLAVSSEVVGETQAAAIVLRQPIRFGQSTSFVLDYALLDAAAPTIRVRPSATVVTVWGFGTTSSITVDVPAGYEVTVDGDELQVERGAEFTRLTSGPISAPPDWAAVVTASRPADLVTLHGTAELASGVAEIRVQAWADDEEWGRETLALLERSLPVLERLVGLPYRAIDVLTVTESVSRSATALDISRPEAGADILIGFDQPPFTTLHEAAHVWMGPALFRSRWIYEGFASHYASLAADELGIEEPYDPAALRDEHAALAFPLEQWAPAGEASEEQDQYGYPASWALARAMAQRAGDEALRAVVAAIDAGRGAYAPPVTAQGDEGTASRQDDEQDGTRGRAVNAREFLDHLEEQTGVAFDDLFARYVFAAADADLLDERRAVRESYRALEDAGGEWGVPAPVIEAMGRWDFSAAATAIEEATAWLAERDALVAALDRAGLTAPERLREIYRRSGGGQDAEHELQLERGFLERYVEARTSVTGDPSPLERMGLFGAMEPARALDRAADLFAAGDVEAADALVAETVERAETADMSGAVRLIGVAGVLALIAVLVVQRLGRTGRTAPAARPGPARDG